MKHIGIICLVLVLCMPSAAQRPNAAAKQLHALFDSEWTYKLKASPIFATFLGDKRFNDRWDDKRIAAYAERNQRNIQSLAKLRIINRLQLSAKDRVNYDLFEVDLQSSIEEYQARLFLLPVDQRNGIQNADEILSLINFESIKDYQDWIGRMNAFPDLMNQTIELMKEGKTQEILWSKQVLNRVPGQIEKQIVSEAEKSPFYVPFTKMSKNLTESDQQRLKSIAKKAIEEKIIPSYVKLRDFFINEYLPACYAQAGIWQIKGGDKIYEFLARDYTTTKLSPLAIHEIGLTEVARIRAEMEEVKTQVAFKGTLQEFFQHLRSDPKFFYKTSDELLNAYRALSKRIDPEVVKVFRTFPRMPYGVIPIPDKIAPDTTTAYYQQPAGDGTRPGYYYVNLYKPEVRPKWEMMALSIHEAVPGHHFQIALQQELGEVPNFRKYGGYTAFVEGWGLYSESLGEEMGLYSDPYDKFGQLTYEMWRAVRLVVDTGMHYFKWDRQRAIDFFKANAAKTEQDIVNEIDRYISNPGQALAYKIGELKIKELRAQAKQSLGEKFDVKEFHDVVLLSGAVPLNVLEKNVAEWLARRASKLR